MTEIPNSPEFHSRSVVTIDTDLLHRLEMMKLFFENEGLSEDAIHTSFGDDGLTIGSLVDKLVTTIEEGETMVVGFGHDLDTTSCDKTLKTLEYIRCPFMLFGAVILLPLARRV
mgnify:CR=1 FL=1